MNVMDKARSTPEAKIDWLLKHQQLWEGYPRDSGHRVRMFKAMCEAGLYAPNTHPMDANIAALVNEARKRRRETMKQ